MSDLPAPVLIPALVHCLLIGALVFVWWPPHAFPAAVDREGSRLVPLLLQGLLLILGGFVLSLLHLLGLLALLILLVLPALAGTQRAKSPYALSGGQTLLVRLLAGLAQLPTLGPDLAGTVRSLPGRVRRALEALSPLTWGLACLTSALVLFLLRMTWALPWQGSVSSATLLTAIQAASQALAGRLLAGAPPGYPLLLATGSLLTGTPLLVLTLLAPAATALLTLGTLVYVGRALTGRLVPALTAGLAYTILAVWLRMPPALGASSLTPPLMLLAFLFGRLLYTRAEPSDVFGLASVLALAGLLGAVPFIPVATSAILTLGLGRLGGALPVAHRRLLVPALLAALLLVLLPLDVGRFATDRLTLAWGQAVPAYPLFLPALALGLAILALVVTTFRGEPWYHGDLAALALILVASFTMPSGTAPLVALALLVGLLVDPLEGWLRLRFALFGSVSLMAALASGLAAAYRWLPPPTPVLSSPTALAARVYAEVAADLPHFTWSAVDGETAALAAGLAPTYSPAFWLDHAVPAGTRILLNGHVVSLHPVFLFLRHPSDGGDVSLSSRRLERWYEAYRQGGGQARAYLSSPSLTVYELLPEGRTP
jgi:hypothetical protein